MAACAVVSGREFSAELLERLAAEMRTHPEMSRSELSRRVCDWLDWRGPHGEPKRVSCRIALLSLHRRGLIELPKPQGEILRASEVTRGNQAYSDSIDCSLAELDDLKNCKRTHASCPRRCEDDAGIFRAHPVGPLRPREPGLIPP